MVNWFAIYVFIVAIFALGVSILNTIYYNRIRNGACNSVAKKEAETGFWLNIFIAIVTGILVIWAIFWILSRRDEEVVVIQEIEKKQLGPVPIPSTLAPSHPSPTPAPRFPGT